MEKEIEKKIEKVLPYLQNILGKADPTPMVCPICKGTQHLPIPEILQLPYGLFVKPGAEKVKGGHVQAIAFHCTNCGHIELFAIKKD
jgi:hypothetical protein